jgi:uncharacterized RDD family membrane protein YckC
MPYCPVCNQEPDGGARCPTCSVFYQERRCPDCRAEVFPKESFCVACGGELARAAACPTANLEPAGLGRRFAATVVDLLVIMLLAEVMEVAFQNQILAFFGSAILYYGVFQARGRQTLGQYVLRLTTLTEERLPLRFLQSCSRAVLAALSWALVVPPFLALADKARRTPADRLLKVQVFKTP